MSKIEAELLDHPKIKIKKHADRQQYLKNVLASTSALDDDEFNTLSQATQDWANEAAALEAGAPIAEFPDAKKGNSEAKPAKKGKAAKPAPVEEEEEAEDDESEQGSDPDEDEEEAKPAKKAPAKTKVAAKSKDKPAKVEAKGKTAKPASKAAKDKPAKTETKKTRGGPDGMKVQIKKAILKNPGISTDDLIEQMKAGTESAPSKFTVSNIRAEFRHSLRLLADLGLLNKEFDL